MIGKNFIKEEFRDKFIYFRSDIFATLKSRMKSNISSVPYWFFKMCICKYPGQQYRKVTNEEMSGDRFLFL